MRTWGSARWRRGTAAVVVAGVLASVALLAAGSSAPVGSGADGVAMASVPGRPVPAAVDPGRKPEVALPAAAWPAAGSAVVDLRAASGAVRAGGLPVTLTRPGGGTAPGSVKVELLDRQAAERLGVAGVVLQLTREDGASGPGNVRMAVDYSGLRGAFGGGYEQRLRLLRFPACAVTTPEVPGCAQGTAVSAENATVSREVVADVEVAGADAATLETAGSVYALASSTSGGVGSYAATPRGGLWHSAGIGIGAGTKFSASGNNSYNVWSINLETGETS